MNLIEPFFVSSDSERYNRLQERSGVQFTYVKRNQLFFVLTSKHNTMIPSYAQSLLLKIVQVGISAFKA